MNKRGIVLVLACLMHLFSSCSNQDGKVNLSARDTSDQSFDSDTIFETSAMIQTPDSTVNTDDSISEQEIQMAFNRREMSLETYCYQYEVKLCGSSLELNLIESSSNDFNEEVIVGKYFLSNGVYQRIFNN